MTQVHLICGKVGSGKTTLAKRIEVEQGAVRFSLDEWMLHLFEDGMSREIFDTRVQLCLDLMLRLTQRLVELETDVVLDCGFWRRADRQNAYSRVREAQGAPVLYFLDVPAEERWRRLSLRNHHLDADTFKIDKQMFEEFEHLFEAPSDEENPVAILDASC